MVYATSADVQYAGGLREKNEIVMVWPLRVESSKEDVVIKMREKLTSIHGK